MLPLPRADIDAANNLFSGHSKGAPRVFIVLEDSQWEGPPGGPRFDSGTVIVFEYSTLDKVRWNKSLHHPTVGRKHLPRHVTAPGLSTNFTI